MNECMNEWKVTLYVMYVLKSSKVYNKNIKTSKQGHCCEKKAITPKEAKVVAGIFWRTPPALDPEFIGWLGLDKSREFVRDAPNFNWASVASITVSSQSHVGFKRNSRNIWKYQQHKKKSTYKTKTKQTGIWLIRHFTDLYIVNVILSDLHRSWWRHVLVNIGHDV